MMGRKEFLEKVVAIAGLSFVMFTFLGISGVEAQVERTVKVGWFTDLTGPLADSVGTQFPGAQDYFRYLNETEGGIKVKEGRVKVNLLWVDDKSDPTIAVEAYERWRKDPDLIITRSCLSSVVMAVEDKLGADKVPILYAAGTLKVVMEPVRDYVYMVGFPRDMVIAGLVDWFFEKWQKKEPPKFAMISNDQGWAKHCMLEGGGAKYAKARGMNVVKQIVVPTFPTDTTSELRAIKEAGADFIYGNFCPMTAVIVLKDARRVGLDIPIILDQCCNGPDILELAGKTSEGVYFTPNTAQFKGLAKQFMNPGLKKAEKMHEMNRPGKSVDSYVMGVKDAALITEFIKMALKKVSIKQLNGEAIKKYGIDVMKGFDCEGITGPMHFPPDNHLGMHYWHMYQQRNGELVPVVDWREAPFVTDSQLLKSKYLKPGTWKELLGK
jgi:ABC-type branched-subunit amino acid transport system substrate-binding protein